MAGDWLKMEAATPDKAETLAITAAMGWDDADLTVGKLFRVWRWFDSQTLDGNAPGVTPALLDRVAGVTGFAQAMQSVGWLEISEAGITLPNFDRHNGATAKARALTAKRVNKFKRGNARSVTSNVTSALPREEKRREEKKKEKTSSSPKKSAQDLVEGFALEQKHRDWATKNCPMIDVDRELDAWRDRLRTSDYRYGKAKTPVADAQASFYTACRYAQEKAEQRHADRRGRRDFSQYPALPTVVAPMKD